MLTLIGLAGNFFLIFHLKPYNLFFLVSSSFFLFFFSSFVCCQVCKVIWYQPTSCLLGLTILTNLVISKWFFLLLVSTELDRNQSQVVAINYVPPSWSFLTHRWRRELFWKSIHLLVFSSLFQRSPSLVACGGHFVLLGFNPSCCITTRRSEVRELGLAYGTTLQANLCASWAIPM